MPTLDALSRAYNHVRGELDSLGLLADRLEAIDCILTAWPAGWWNTSGFVYDRGVGTLDALAGFREGAKPAAQSDRPPRGRSHRVATPQ